MNIMYRTAYAPKTRTTMKATKFFYHVLSVNYCDLQDLLSGAGIQPESYCCGIYGWNCDNYIVHAESYHTEGYMDIAISTGYRPVSGTIKIPYNNIRIANDTARLIHDKFDGEERTKRIKALFEEFITYLTGRNTEIDFKIYCSHAHA